MSFFFENERLPQIFGNGRQPKSLVNKDDLNILENGEQSQYFCKWKTTSISF